MRVGRWSAWLALLVALLAVLEGIRSGIFVAGGADAYGYVTQASLWANLQLRVQEPLAAIVPSLGSAVAPLGYRLGTVPGTIVPVYSPGLPLLMAIALKVERYICCLLRRARRRRPVHLAHVLDWRPYRGATNRSCGGRPPGMQPDLSASAVRADERRAGHSMVAHGSGPGDVGGAVPALLAGCAAAIALLTRPNLLPLVVPVGLFISGRTASSHQGRAVHRRPCSGVSWHRLAQSMSLRLAVRVGVRTAWRALPMGAHEHQPPPVHGVAGGAPHRLRPPGACCAARARSGRGAGSRRCQRYDNLAPPRFLRRGVDLLSLLHPVCDTWPFLRFLLPAVPACLAS